MKKIIRLLLVLILAFGLVGCIGTDENNSTVTAQKANEESITDLIKNDQLPRITKSLERENLKRRIEFINQPDNIGYLYLLSQNGQLIKEVQVLGKVSSLNSFLTPNYIEVRIGNGGVQNIEQADLDGTWGENVDGIFWFTAEGVYQEWSGLYFYSAERMTFTTPPVLIEIEK